MVSAVPGHRVLRVSIDETRCCGSGNCVLTAPDVFDQRITDGVAVVRAGPLSADQAAQAREAAGMCPTTAICLAEGDDHR